MRMQIVTSTGHRFPFSIKMLFLLVGGTALLTFAFFGRDLSPKAEHYANRAATETVTLKVIAPAEAGEITLTFTDPAQNVRQPAGYTPQYQIGGWPSPQPEPVSSDQEAPASDGTYANEARTQGLTLNPHRFAQTMEDGSVFDPAEYPACTSDDGSGPRPCFWDASQSGNGVGSSFFVAANGRVTPLG